MRKASTNTVLVRVAQQQVPEGRRDRVLRRRRLASVLPRRPRGRAPASVVDLRERNAAADGVLIATPEYSNIVLFKLNERVTRDSAEAEARMQLVKDLDKQIHEVRHWDVGWHTFDGFPGTYDWALNSLFDGTEAFMRFLNHPAHQAPIAHWKNHASWVVVDVHV
ncbi:Dabb family protein [Nonomuraea insulae]|uniref:Dabb family protein n=1 Tax=Nonomuraea insulae TaxID=1616787 RepID=A0ABW1DCW9_9ACTN